VTTHPDKDLEGRSLAVPSVFSLTEFISPFIQEAPISGCYPEIMEERPSSPLKFWFSPGLFIGMDGLDHFLALNIPTQMFLLYTRRGIVSIDA
jgi:hypothetical protein